jgi:DNA primase
MDDSEKELIRERTDIVEVISAYTTLKRSGNKFKGLCPFHQERTPSFQVDPERGRWHCFGQCQEGGDIFTFLEKAESLSFMEAAERLAERAGIVLSGRGNSEEALRQRNERERLYAANAAAVEFFRDAFSKATLAQEYAEKRGLVYETREQFAIGYAPEDWDQLSRFLQRKKIHPEDAVKAGLISPSRRGDGHYIDRFRGRLIFPIVDVQERVVGFGGRLIVNTPDAPKYLNSPETPVFSKSRILYALNRGKKAIAEKRLAVVVEGYMDAVAAHQAGIPYVIATLGTALTEEHVRLLRRYVGEKGSVALSFDADKAGVNAALKAAELIFATSNDITLRVLALPPGEDPDSLIASGRSAEFHKAIEEALTVPEFRLKTLENLYDLRSEAGQMEYLRESVEIIASLPSLLEQDRLIRLVAAHHPSFTQNSLRAEELLRAEVGQVSRRNSARPTERYPSSSEIPPSPIEGQPYRGAVIGPRKNWNNKGRGNAHGYSGQGGQSGQRYGQRYGGKSHGNQPYGQGYPTQDFREIPPRAAWNATETAERTLVRALLSEEWCPVLVRRFPAPTELPPFASRTVSRLFEALWSLVSGKVSPKTALAELNAPDLADFADTVLMAEGEPDLSEEAIEDAARQLLIRSLQAKNAEIRAVLLTNQEGNTETDEETLRRWSQIARTLRGKGLGQNTGEE